MNFENIDPYKKSGATFFSNNRNSKSMIFKINPFLKQNGEVTETRITFKVASEAEQWGRISWLTKILTKFRIFARFLHSALSAFMARIWNFVKFSVNNFIRSRISGIDATLVDYHFCKVIYFKKWTLRISSSLTIYYE